MSQNLQQQIKKKLKNGRETLFAQKINVIKIEGKTNWKKSQVFFVERKKEAAITFLLENKGGHNKLRGEESGGCFFRSTHNSSDADDKSHSIAMKYDF